jgi:hypothetical protein
MGQKKGGRCFCRNGNSVDFVCGLLQEGGCHFSLRPSLGGCSSINTAIVLQGWAGGFYLEKCHLFESSLQ